MRRGVSPSTTIAGLVLASLLAGCAGTAPQSTLTRGWDRIDGAFVSHDTLYLLGRDRDYALEPAAFAAYRALMDGPLRQQVVCTEMRGDLFLERDAAGQPGNRFDGSYSLLLRADAVTQALATQYRLQAIDIDPADPRPAPALWYRFDRRACGLDEGKARYYAVSFSSRGQALRLDGRDTLLATARSERPLPLALSVYSDRRARRHPLRTVAALLQAPVLLVGWMTVDQI